MNPEIELKEVRMLCKEGRDVCGCVSVNKMSSAKRDNLYSRCCKCTPRMSGWHLIATARGSKLQIKSKGDKGEHLRQMGGQLYLRGRILV